MNWYLFLAVCGLCLFLGVCSRDANHSNIGWWFARRGWARYDRRHEQSLWPEPLPSVPSTGLWQAVQPWYGNRGIRAITRDTTDRTWELTPRGWRCPDRSAVVAGKLLSSGYPPSAVTRFVDRYQDYLPDTQREQLAAHLDRDVP